MTLALLLFLARAHTPQTGTLEQESEILDLFLASLPTGRGSWASLASAALSSLLAE